MSNWCYTNYKVTGDEAELKDLYNKMDSLDNMEDSLIKNGFGKNWLGNLITLLGGDWKKIRCRGSITWLELEDGVLRFDTETAWVDMRETIDFLQEKYPSLIFSYIAEEPGCEYYVVHDSIGDMFPERYCVDCKDGDSLYYCEGEEEQLLDDISKLIGEKVSSIKDAYSKVALYNHDKDWENMIEFRIYREV
jgi:hypothetical protein